MSRSLLALMLLGMIGAAQGCRICDSPYDYCGPVMPCGDSCVGCGHGHHGHGGYVESGYSGGHGGCSTCGNGGGHSEHSMEYDGGTVIQTQPSQGQPTPAPMPAPMQQGRRPLSKSMTKATYDEPAAMTRSPYPAARTAKAGSGPIFW